MRDPFFFFGVRRGRILNFGTKPKNCHQRTIEKCHPLPRGKVGPGQDGYREKVIGAKVPNDAHTKKWDGQAGMFGLGANSRGARMAVLGCEKVVGANFAWGPTSPLEGGLILIWIKELFFFSATNVDFSRMDAILKFISAAGIVKLNVGNDNVLLANWQCVFFSEEGQKSAFFVRI